MGEKGILILGAGLAGLSAAFHLPAGPVRIIEKEEGVGGLCRSVREDGFTFDCSGHLLCLRSEYVRTLLNELPSIRLDRHERRSAISWGGGLVPYPFQANLGALPKEAIRECLLGFVESLVERSMEEDGGSFGGKGDFLSWILRTFGRGIARHFMVPYNRKMWKVPLEGMTDDWVGWSIPKPALEQVIDGALGIPGPSLGYHATFHYPRGGGIGLLPKAFAERLQGKVEILLGREALRWSPREREVELAGEVVLPYSRMISTMPLPKLIEIGEGLPSWMQEACREFRAIGVRVFNIGLCGPPTTDQHWIYFPEKEYPFFRVGIYSNFSKHLVPEGCGSLYVEISYLPDQEEEEGGSIEGVVEGLVRAGLLRDPKDIVTVQSLELFPAYVIFDPSRRRHLPRILAELERWGVHSIGRYGAWDYLTMEDSILHGKEVAERLR